MARDLQGPVGGSASFSRATRYGKRCFSESDNSIDFGSHQSPQSGAAGEPPAKGRKQRRPAVLNAAIDLAKDIK